MEKRFRFALPVAVACALISLLCFLAPMYLIRPFRESGGEAEFAFAMKLLRAGPVISAICALVAMAVVLLEWRKIRLLVCLFFALLGAVLTRINVFEVMFHPYPGARFVAGDSAAFDKDEMVMSLTVGTDAHAYPVGAMGYHHIVNDVVGGIPVAVTYCTLCHTGIVWKRVVDGQLLTFRLGGIRNDNALLRDEQTNSIWQQSTGVAIYGPLKGKQLELVHSDELTFALWKTEQPRGYILKPNPKYAPLYEKKGWEKTVEAYPAAIDTARSGIKPRELMLGISLGSASKAYPFKSVLSARVIQDRVGGVPIVLMVAADGVSVRAFRADCPGSDSHKCPQPLDIEKVYWFDWHANHPTTEVFPK